jgi:hypothetical protein
MRWTRWSGAWERSTEPKANIHPTDWPVIYFSTGVPPPQRPFDNNKKWFITPGLSAGLFWMGQSWVFPKEMITVNCFYCYFCN